MLKSLPTMGKTWVGSLVWEDPLEEEMTTHSSILEHPVDRGACWATVLGLQRVRHN